jgi:hypothetical protein
MTTQADYVTAIGKLVPGTVPLVEADQIMAIGMAMLRYSKDHPRIAVQDITGDAGFDYAISGLTAWADDFSTIRQVEYPVDDDDETADVLDEDQWAIYQKPAGKQLRFLDEKPTAEESFRVTHTALHTCTVSACTVGTFDEKAVQALCAAIFCDMIATYYAQNKDSTINADSVDHKSQAAEYSSRANKYRKMYYSHIGVKEGSPPPASHTQDQDVNGPGGTDRLTHPRRFR